MIPGGAHWDTVYDDATKNLGTMFFLNKDVGYIACDTGKVIKTLDGGITWQILNTGTLFQINSIFFLNPTTGFVAGNAGHIKRTVDGGTTWTDDNVGGITDDFLKILFVDDTVGYAIIDHRMYQTNRYSVAGIWTLSEKMQNLMAYPTPTTGKLSVEIPALFQNNKNAILDVYDCYGKLVESVPTVNETMEIDLSSHAKGLYFINVSDGTTRFHCKTILE